MAELRAKIYDGQPSRDSMQQIVEAAWVLTGADGAAIAMRQNNLVFCTARAGTMAPALGSRLSSDSGISAECLRTGRAFCCGDTSIDTRVDSDACRRLGLRSLVAAPVGNRPVVTGILEAFSPEAHAFNDTHVQLLGELAQLVLAAQSTRRQWSTLKTRAKLLGAAWKWQILIMAAALLSFVGWLAFRGKAPLSTASKTIAAHGSGELPSSAAEQPTERLEKPSPAASRQPAAYSKVSFPPGVVIARTTERADNKAAIEARTSSAASYPSTVVRGATRKPSSEALSNPQQLATAPSLEVMSDASNPLLSEILSPARPIPIEPAVRISQGLSGGKLERRVNPIYPPEAARRRIEGRVLLEAQVSEEGTVRVLKVIEGDQMLIRAATEAVTQWHFEPFRLNGQPIERTTDITLIFKLPGY
ncbi:MAG: TonB family protein [Acidobacteria bacterium]|nr:TonB family protein [Acidobacteriota bacterium]